MERFIDSDRSVYIIMFGRGAVTMTDRPNWLRDELTLPGVDFADAGEADAHVRMVGEDIALFERISKLIDLKPEMAMIDFGAGAGGFAVYAAKRCKQVIAVDVSSAMLSIACEKAKATGVSNIQFVHAGFLNYQHEARLVDVVVSHQALHHLPDNWKMVALARLAGMLKPGGRFHLRDIAHTFDPRDPKIGFDQFVNQAVRLFGEGMRTKAETTIRDEFPTWDWIIEGMLRRAELRIDLADYRSGLAEYLCTKVPTER
jgi:putative AdoMet-dependent methyltransferase